MTRSKKRASKKAVAIITAEKPDIRQLVSKQQSPSKPPASKPPASKPPASKPPASKPPASKPPASKPPASKPTNPIRPTHTNPNPFNPLQYMTPEDLSQLNDQFATSLKDVDTLLFWTGVERDHVQRWANRWNLKTLTTAMGPLMDPANHNGPKAQKSRKAYSRYVKGASGHFADYARRHCRVVVLTNPPPNIYSTRDGNTYQSLEEPILFGRFGGSPVRRIDYVHPAVEGAAHILYQTWPCNKTDDWVATFGKGKVRKWKKLNWSYRSIITTSHLDLRPSQRRSWPFPANPRVPGLGRLTEREEKPADDFLLGVGNLPAIVTDSDHARDIVAELEITQLQRNTGPTKKEQSSTTANIRGHDSQISAQVSTEAEAEPMVVSDTHPLDTQTNDPSTQRTNSHKTKLLFEPARTSSAPPYVARKCGKPELPLRLLVIDIGDLTIGEEVTIDINDIDVGNEFLFLTMRMKDDVECWWKLSWT